MDSQKRGSASSTTSTRQLRSAALNATPVRTGSAKKKSPCLRTGLVYDDRMLATRNIWLPDHAERPERISACYERAKALELVDRCVKIPARYATESEIAEIHTDSLMEDMRKSQKASEEELIKLSEKHGTHFDNAAFECALLSAGCALNLADAILSNQCDNGMAIIRPPGHHASTDKADGYCFFNNAALVAHRALTKHGLNRVMIIDWDVHHGQGTQRFFYNSRNVLYVSMHRYEYGKYWPYLRESDWDFIGASKGLGYNVNVPMNKTGMGDSDYMAVFHQVILPLARDYNPELVIISAGYDAAIGCPEGQMLLSPASYAHFTHSLRQFASGHVCVLLEGGYCLKSLAESAALTLRDLLGDPCPPLPAGSLVPASPTLTRVLLLLMRTLRPYWPSTFAYNGKTTSLNQQWTSWLNLASKRRSKIRFDDDYRTVFEQWTPTENTGYQSKEVAEQMNKLIDSFLFVPRPLAKYTRLCVVVSAGDALLLHKVPAHEIGHPECPERVVSIVNRLEAAKIINHDDSGMVEVIKSRPATRDELLTVHTPGHVDEVEQIPNMTEEDINEWAMGQNSLYACQESPISALHAVGGVIEAVDMVMTGRSASAFAAVRPPGHHSDSYCASGFCLFNNVAVAAKVAQQKYNLERILIIDWDVHFGDGTSAIFYDDPSMLYVSLHRFDHGRFYPGKQEADYDYVGRGPGTGFNINIPWSGGRMGPAEYIAAFERVVMPIAYEYDPQLVFISSGFDACVNDPLGGYSVTPDAFAAMTLYLSSLAGGRCVIALEGGYNLNSISDASEACCRALLGLAPSWAGNYNLDKPVPSAVDMIYTVLETQSEFWKCISPFRVALPQDALGETGKSESGSAKKGAPKNLRQQRTPSPAVLSTDLMPPPVPKPTPVAPSAITGSSITMNDLEEAFERVAITNRESTATQVSQNVADALGISVTVALSEDNVDDNLGFLVEVLPSCPHADDPSVVCCRRMADLPNDLADDSVCYNCNDPHELWICLTCYKVGCGRYRSKHAVEHFEQSNERHALALGLSDFSLWCYKCEAYIDPRKASAIYCKLYSMRFGDEPPNISVELLK